MKQFVAKRHWNHIGHRVLTPYEKRYPEQFAMTFMAFDTWEEAQTALIALRTKELDKARRELRSAERSLVKVKTMKKPEALA